MRVYTYEDSRRTAVMRELLEEGLPPEYECVRLFPIPTTKDGVTVNGSHLQIREGLKELSDGELVVGYGIPTGLKRDLERAGITVADAAEDEEFLLANAYLTALGTLGYILTGSPCVPADMHIGIIGYGRIGSALTRLLLPLGAEVTVYTARQSVREELGSYGVRTEGEEDFGRLDRLSVLINTAPAPLLLGVQKPQGLRVIDLASGNNLSFWEGVERYPSVPTLLYPDSAARIWYQSVLRSINKCK